MDVDDGCRGRRDGIRQARRVSNWTAAALIAGTAVAAVGLAHQALPAQAPAAGTAARAAGPAACAQGANAPRVTHSVATTSASGVTTTTTRTVNCKTVVTQVRNVAAHEDD
ncbi:MAG TPA: hypothetical protein VKU77_08065 [Streptosporangiaceae bacterium]|nr:hypothetical protein [Streptosporangiaceae bacterium]